MLAVPGNAGGQLGNVFAERIVFVPGVGQGYVLPGGIIESRRFRTRRIAHKHFPPGVEIVFHPGRTRLGE